jgi:hypothetical protein
MQLVSVLEDSTMLVTGYEHQTWHCSGCDELERRMIFRHPNSRLGTTDPGGACEDHGRLNERIPVSASNQAIQRCSKGQFVLELRQSLAGRISATVRWLRDYLAVIRHRASRKANHAVESTAPIPSQTSNEKKDVQEELSAFENFDQPWESHVSFEPCARRDATNHEEPAAEAFVGPALPSPAPGLPSPAKPALPSPAKQGEVVLKKLTEYENFDQLWESLAPSRN